MVDIWKKHCYRFIKLYVSFLLPKVERKSCVNYFFKLKINDEKGIKLI